MFTLRSYVRVLFQRLPIPLEKKILRFIQLCSIAIIITFASVLWVRDWYQVNDNINGILVEVHGALFEVLLLSVLFDWYTRKRERLLHADIKSALNYCLYQAVTNLLCELDHKFVTHKKQYIYFGEKTAITRAYDLVDYITNNKNLRLLAAMYPSIKDLELRHLAAAKKFLESIRRSYDIFMDFTDKELLLILIKAEEATDDRVISLSTPRTTKGGEEVTKSIIDILNDNNRMALHALQLKEILESRADRIESREEHSKATQEKLAEMRELRP